MRGGRRWWRVRAGKHLGSTPGAVGRDEPRGRRARPAGAQDAGRFRRGSGPGRPIERQGDSGDLLGERASDGDNRGGGILVALLRCRSWVWEAKGCGKVRGLLLRSEGNATLASGTFRPQGEGFTNARSARAASAVPSTLTATGNGPIRLDPGPTGTSQRCDRGAQRASRSTSSTPPHPGR